MFLDKVPRGSLVGLDTMVFIYHAQAHPIFGPLAREIIHNIERGVIHGSASTLMVTEVLTGYRKRNDAKSEDLFWNLLALLKPSLLLIPFNVEIADRAAWLRVRYNLRTPDAIHIATAIASGANFYITNDRRLQSVKEISIILLAT